MPLETATYIDQLVVTNPASSDGMNKADDHMRMIKASMKNTFPGATGPLTNVDGGFISRSDGSPAEPAYSFASEPTLGFYRSAAGFISVTGGGLIGGVPTGAVQMFLAPPASLGTATAHTGKQWLELNGASYNVTDYPALASFLGISSGTFTLDDMYTLGRFPRSRTAATAARTAQANTVGPHTHPNQDITTGTESQDHVHGFTGTTGSMNRSNPHSHGLTGSGDLVHNDAGYGGGVGGGGSFGHITNSLSVNATDINHEHAFSGTTGGRNAAHTHSATVPTPANTGTTETRPEALSFVFAVKT